MRLLEVKSEYEVQLSELKIQFDEEINAAKEGKLDTNTRIKFSNICPYSVKILYTIAILHKQNQCMNYIDL